MPDASRIVFTVACGKRRYGEMAMGLARSLSLIGDLTPRAIVTDIDGFDWNRYFDIVVRRSFSPDEAYFSKLSALECTDAQKVLFIDSDCLAFKRLDPIFDAFGGSPMGVQGVRLTCGKWYEKDVAKLCRAEGIADLPKFNSGLLYYERTPETERVIAEAKSIAKRYDQIGFRWSSVPRSKGAIPDEPCIALAMARTGIGRVVSDKANFQNSGVGLVGRLRMNVRRNECRYLCRRYNLEYVEPYIFHAHFYGKFLLYWRQLKALEQLERFEDRHPFGHMSTGHKWSRSIQRRLIKILYRSRGHR